MHMCDFRKLLHKILTKANMSKASFNFRNSEVQGRVATKKKIIKILFYYYYRYFFSGPKCYLNQIINELCWLLLLLELCLGQDRYFGITNVQVYI